MTRKPSSDPVRRALLLDAAALLFEQAGPNKTTVADIARAAGVSVGSVYLEFPGKGGILAALAARRLRGIVDAMAAAAAAQPPGPRAVAAALTARTEAFLADPAAAPRAEALARCDCDALHATWQGFVAQQAQLIDALLQAGAAAGQLAPDAATLRPALLDAYASLLPPALHHRSPAAARATLTGLHRLVLAGLGAIREVAAP